MEDDELGSNICCPECGEISDAYEAYIEGGAQSRTDGCVPCLYCGAEVPAEDWITD